MADIEQRAAALRAEIDQRLQAWRAAGSGAQPADSDPPLRERHAGAQGDQYAESETEGP